jgi:hypothetical protein
MARRAVFRAAESAALVFTLASAETARGGAAPAAGAERRASKTAGAMDIGAFPH